jgi:hypothetical protein
MSNAGKKMLNWKRDFPVERTALGLLGKAGFASILAGRFLLGHESFYKIREACRALGRELSEDSMVSRMKRVEELDWLKANRPNSYRRGEALAKTLIADLRAAQIQPFEVID